MADQKTTALTAAATVDAADLLYLVTDVAGTPTSKKVTTVLMRSVRQQVNTQTGAMSTGTTTIPFDDTVPQNTEGTEVLTLAITPGDAANILVIESDLWASTSAQAWIIGAIFQDTTANALAVNAQFHTTATAGGALHLQYRMVAGTTSSTTFKLRFGPHTAATVTVNGQSGSRKFGGVAVTAITITEYRP